MRNVYLLENMAAPCPPPYTSDMSVTGLYGCSSVVVLSKNGIYMSHLWEEPSFTPYDTPYDKARFDNQILQALKNGDGPRMPGLLALSQHGGIFAPNSEPSTFIITPSFALPRDKPLWRYPRQVIQTKRLLKSMIETPAGQVEPTVLTYFPQRDPYDPHQRNRVSGKILFQYDPLQPLHPSTANTGCVAPRQQPMLKLWVAASPRPVFEKTWVALPHQLGPRKRGLPEDTCGIPDPKTTETADSQGSSHEVASRTSASASRASTKPLHPQLPSISSPSPAGINSSEASSVVHRTSTITVVPLPLSSFQTSYRTSTITVIPLPLSTVTMRSSIVYRTSTVTVVPIPLSSFSTSYPILTITVIPLPQSTVTTRNGN